MLPSVTIKEISNISGYSISTVSKALNDRYEIKESTKEKIRKIARSKNYVPNNAARALRNKRTNIIAVIVPKITSSYFNNFICQVQKKASKINYKIIIAQSFNDIHKEKESIVQMNDGTVDGVLILSNNKFMDVAFEEQYLKNVIVVPFDEQVIIDHLHIRRKARKIFDELISLINAEHRER